MRDELDNLTKDELDNLTKRVAVIEDELLRNQQSDQHIKTIVDTQKAQISSLQKDNESKSKAFSSLSRWVVILVLGIFSLTSRYEGQFTRSGGIEIHPKEDTGWGIPTLYAVSIIAVATGNDKALFNLLANVTIK